MTEPERLLIAGSRAKWWENPERVAEFIDQLVDGLDPESTVLVNGLEPSGVDHWALGSARRRGIPIDPHAADWDRFGRRAGVLRNEEMAQVCNRVWLVWDGCSPGTKSMLDLAIKYRRPLSVWFP